METLHSIVKMKKFISNVCAVHFKETQQNIIFTGRENVLRNQNFIIVIIQLLLFSRKINSN